MTTAKQAREVRIAKGQPHETGWYWAQWRMASQGTRDGDELTPSDEWECVQVNENCYNEASPEYLSVSVAGVEKCQWPDDFNWGPRVVKPGDLQP